jgi:hypothetical protein
LLREELESQRTLVLTLTKRLGIDDEHIEPRTVAVPLDLSRMSFNPPFTLFSALPPRVGRAGSGDDDITIVRPHHCLLLAIEALELQADEAA